MAGAYRRDPGHILVLIRGQDSEHYDPPIEINASGDSLWAVMFSAHGEHLVSGSELWVRMWREEDGEEIAKWVTREKSCVARWQIDHGKGVMVVWVLCD